MIFNFQPIYFYFILNFNFRKFESSNKKFEKTKKNIFICFRPQKVDVSCEKYSFSTQQLYDIFR